MENGGKGQEGKKSNHVFFVFSGRGKKGTRECVWRTWAAVKY